jgi:hypothetical protein
VRALSSKRNRTRMIRVARVISCSFSVIRCTIADAPLDTIASAQLFTDRQIATSALTAGSRDAATRSMVQST